jgi:hypothetical protein
MTVLFVMPKILIKRQAVRGCGRMFVRSAGLSDTGDRRANASQNESQQMIPRDLRITIRLFVELG